MRKPFAIALLVTILGSTVFFYFQVQTVCPTPLTYRVGDIDEQFGVTREAVELAALEAVGVWEDGTGANLFRFDPEGELMINLIYDEQQAFIDAQEELIGKLDASLSVKEAIEETYRTLTTEFDTLSAEYNERRETYLTELETHNAWVAELNQSGTATAEDIEVLEKQQQALEAEQASLNELNSRIGELSARINTASNQIAGLVDRYNEKNSEFNSTYAGNHEFTPGYYQNKEINISKFSNNAELRLVLAHELGHALSFDHLADEEAVMHAKLGAQPEPLQLSAADVAEYKRVCENRASTYFTRVFASIF